MSMSKRVVRRVPSSRRSRLDGDGLRRADRLAQLAGDAAFLAIGIAAQRMLAPEARADRPLLMRIVDRLLRREELAHRQEEGADEILQQQRFGGLAESGHHANPVILRKAATITTIASEIGRKTFQPRRISWS